MAIELFKIAASGGRSAFEIYAEPANINYFLKVDLTPSTASGASNKQVSVKAHTRRQYPGDATTFNVPSSQREVLIDPSKKSGNGLPGRSFKLTSDAGLPGEETRQFTLRGRFVDLHAWLGANVDKQVYLHTNAGTRYTIPASGTP
jgi:hypothetical protein